MASLTFEANVGAHAHQFLSMHEAVLEDGFRHERDTAGLCHQGHVLSLKIGGETRVFFGRHIDRVERAAGLDVDGGGVGLEDSDAGFGELGSEGAEMVGYAVGDGDVALR